MTQKKSEIDDSAAFATGSSMTAAPAQAGQELRRRAEKKIRAEEAQPRKIPSPEEAARIVHELRVHKIEMEMQNEELRRAQAELETSRARYFDLYDLAPVGYFTLDEKGLIQEANLTAASLLGVTRSALVKQPVTRFILKEDQDLYYQHRNRLLGTHWASSGQADEPLACELRLLKNDGTAFWARLEATAVRGADGASPVGRRGEVPEGVRRGEVPEGVRRGQVPEGVDFQGSPVCRVVLSDITRLKKVEEKSRESEERYRALFDRSLDCVYIHDFEGRFIDANNATLNLLGYKREEIRGLDFALLLSEDQLPLAIKTIQEIRETGIQKVLTEFRLRHKNGSGVYVETIGSAILFNGAYVAIQSIARDITERKRAEEAIRASLREKEILLREIHHRVKNTMQVISSLFNLQSGHTLNQEVRRILKEGQTRIRAMSLVHEKLYQSRNLLRIDLAAYIQSLVVYLFQVYVVDPEQVRLETNFGEVSLDINSAVPCGLILSELISNSLMHAFPEGRKGLIRIGLKCGSDGMIVIRVADDGIGFPDTLDFRKSESFGLQIVKLLVGQLGAELTLARKQGTVITVTFRELKYAPRI